MNGRAAGRMARDGGVPTRGNPVAGSTQTFVGATTWVQAAVYSGLIHSFKMKELPTDDPLFGKGEIQATGRKVHPAYLFEAKAPSESKGPWDDYRLVGTTPADEAFRPLSESACPLLKK